MKKSIIVLSAFLITVSSVYAASSLSPSFTIRYEDFINDLTPTASVGLRLDIDGDRYTGFDVNTDASDTRLLIGWKWGVMGIGSVTTDNGVTWDPHYTFGVSYEIVEGLNSNFEYVMTPDVADIPDRLRLSLSISF